MSDMDRCVPFNATERHAAMEWKRQFPSPGTCRTRTGTVGRSWEEGEVGECLPFRLASDSHSPGRRVYVRERKPSGLIWGDGFHGGGDEEEPDDTEAWEGRERGLERGMAAWVFCDEESLPLVLPSAVLVRRRKQSRVVATKEVADMVFRIKLHPLVCACGKESF